MQFIFELIWAKSRSRYLTAMGQSGVPIDQGLRQTYQLSGPTAEPYHSSHPTEAAYSEQGATLDTMAARCALDRLYDSWNAHRCLGR
jgi:hypothetical protein